MGRTDCNHPGDSIIPGEVDPLLEIIGPSGKLLGTSENARDKALNAVLSGIEILEDGTYTLALSNANGESEGNIALSLDLHWRRGPGSR